VIQRPINSLRREQSARDFAKVGLARIFAERKQTGKTDMEAVEMALRAAL
jgi:hypothetical protein